MIDYRKLILDAFKRLHKSSTPLIRKRARSEFRIATRHVLKAYPSLTYDANRNVVKRTSAAKFLRCPICGNPMVHSMLAGHIRARHTPPMVTNYLGEQCPCCDRIFNTVLGLTRHLVKLAESGALLDHMIHKQTQKIFATKKGQA